MVKRIFVLILIGAMGFSAYQVLQQIGANDFSQVLDLLGKYPLIISLVFCFIVILCFYFGQSARLAHMDKLLNRLAPWEKVLDAVGGKVSLHQMLEELSIHDPRKVVAGLEMKLAQNKARVDAFEKSNEDMPSLAERINAVAAGQIALKVRAETLNGVGATVLDSLCEVEGREEDIARIITDIENRGDLRVQMEKAVARIKGFEDSLEGITQSARLIKDVSDRLASLQNGQLASLVHPETGIKSVLVGLGKMMNDIDQRIKDLKSVSTQNRGQVALSEYIKTLEERYNTLSRELTVLNTLSSRLAVLNARFVPESKIEGKA